MTLFHEKNKEKKPLSKARRRLRLGLWIVLSLTIFMVCGTLFLIALSGSSVPLQKGMENYLRNTTGMEASIGRFTYVEFFPNMKLDIGKVELHAPDRDGPAITIDSLIISRRFSDQFSTPHRMEKLAIEGVRVGSGLMTARELIVDRFSFDEQGYKGGPGLVVAGHYGGDAFTGRLAMEITRKEGHTEFSRPLSAPVEFDSPFLKLEGALSTGDAGDMILNLKSLGFPEKMMEGRIQFGHGGKDGPALSGRLVDLSQDREYLAKRLHALYCLFAPPDRPFLKNVSVGDLSVDNMPFTEFMKEESAKPCGKAP